MKIVIIGTGNTATMLGEKIKESGHRLLQVVGRDATAAKHLAQKIGADYATSLRQINKDGDIFIIAVSDDAIGEVADRLQLNDKIVVHTAASVSKDVLLKCCSRYGVFYPMQSLRKESTYLPPISIVVDAGDEKTLTTLKNLASTITETVVEADDEKRQKMHLAAVFCNNFTNHLYTLVEDYCKKEGISFQLFYPLIMETAFRATEVAPHQSQTGPAKRKDMVTIEKHQQQLQQHPELKELYEVFTESIMRHH